MPVIFSPETFFNERVIFISLSYRLIVREFITYNKLTSSILSKEKHNSISEIDNGFS